MKNKQKGIFNLIFLIIVSVLFIVVLSKIPAVVHIWETYTKPAILIGLDAIFDLFRFLWSFVPGN